MEFRKWFFDFTKSVIEEYIPHVEEKRGWIKSPPPLDDMANCFGGASPKMDGSGFEYDGWIDTLPYTPLIASYYAEGLLLPLEYILNILNTVSVELEEGDAVYEEQDYTLEPEDDEFENALVRFYVAQTIGHHELDKTRQRAVKEMSSITKEIYGFTTALVAGYRYAAPYFRQIADEYASVANEAVVFVRRRPASISVIHSCSESESNSRYLQLIIQKGLVFSSVTEGVYHHALQYLNDVSHTLGFNLLDENLDFGEMCLSVRNQITSIMQLPPPMSPSYQYTIGELRREFMAVTASRKLTGYASEDMRKNIFSGTPSTHAAKALHESQKHGQGEMPNIPLPRNHHRDKQWNEWSLEGLGPAAIRDRWDDLSAEERLDIAKNKRAARSFEELESEDPIDLIKKAIGRYQKNHCPNEVEDLG